MRLHRLVVLGFLVACGGMTVDVPDGGSDAATDALPKDATPTSDGGNGPDGSDGAPDATVDAPLDALTDAGKPVVDAAYVDLDASTAPWATTVGLGELNAVAVDGQQNILVGGQLGSSGYYSFFLGKMDSSGASLWSKTANYGVAYSVAFDASGNMIAAGLTGTTVDLGGGTIGPGSFVVKYDPLGKFLWSYGPFQNTIFTLARAKSTGSVVAFGTLTGSDDYGGGVVNCSGRCAVLVEVTNAKTFVDARTWAGTDQASTGLAIDAWDDIFLAGRFAGTIDFGGGAMTGPSPNSGSYDNFIVELDSSWTYQHQMDTQTSSNNDSLSALTTDSSGDLFIAGSASSGVNLGGSTLSCGGGVIGMLDSSFHHVWSKCYAHAGGGGLSADPADGVGYAGLYNNNATFGQGTLPPYTGAFLARFDTTGKSLASFGSGSSSNYGAWASAASYLTWPDYVIVGTCAGPSITFPSGTLTCAPNGEGFVARLAP